MPKSKLRDKVKRKKKIAAVATPVVEPSQVESPKWLAPVMLANFLIGLLWIVIFYISSTAYPIPGIGAWNMVVGFGFVGVGFSLATRWR
ncbi:MAG: cell division protein CrgA [Actinobacteria bacterium]|nr:cell division protein CrgA [Actinomycetota bacterium]